MPWSLKVKPLHATEVKVKCDLYTSVYMKMHIIKDWLKNEEHIKKGELNIFRRICNMQEKLFIQ